MSAPAIPTTRCRSAGRLRDFFRHQVLLAQWRPRALPDAPAQAVADQSLDALVGAALRGRVGHALDQADHLAKRIGGCARDAYTVLYGCAAFAVLFAAWGVTVAGHGILLDLLVASELLVLVLLFLTFHNAHRINWHGRWLGLRFHAEFLRCIPILAALRGDLSPAWLQGRGQREPAAGRAAEPPHLQALSSPHRAGADAHGSAHEQGQQLLRAELYEELLALFRAEPLRYAGSCLAYARLLAQQQLRYHCLRAQQEQTIVQRVHRLSIGGFALTIAAVVAHFWLQSSMLTVISTGVPAFAASLHGFVAQEESERLAASYQLMARRLHDWLEVDLGATGDLTLLQEHLSKLVELMMSEVRDWHRLFGDKGMYHLG